MSELKRAEVYVDNTGPTVAYSKNQIKRVLRNVARRLKFYKDDVVELSWTKPVGNILLSSVSMYPSDMDPAENTVVTVKFESEALAEEFADRVVGILCA